MKKLLLPASLAFLACGALTSRAAAAPGIPPRDFSEFQIINDRNIFDPNRRPRVQNPVQMTRQPQVVDTFSLVGTMSYSEHLLAFFDGTSSDYRKALKVGDRIATYTVADIRHNVIRLSSGTNDVELRVGMQMRRSEDGRWTAAETPAGSSSYASNSRFRGSDRGNDRGDRRFSYGRSESRNGSSSSGGGQSEGGSSEAAPVDLNNLNPDDPVARMILRRMQEEGVPIPGGNNAAAGQGNGRGNGPGANGAMNGQMFQGQPLQLQQQQGEPQQQSFETQQPPQNRSDGQPGNNLMEAPVQETNQPLQTEQPENGELRS